MEEMLGRKVIASRGDAERLVIQVLNFIVADLDRMIQVLNVTGLQPETIRESAKSLLLLGVLDYVWKDEELLKALHQELNIRPDAILVASVQYAPAPEEVKPSGRKPEAVPRLPRRSLYH